MNTPHQPDIFDRMADKWPSTVVASPLVKQFSGGAISGKTLANMSSAGQSVPLSVKIGGKRCYEVASLAAWLRTRSEQAKEIAS
ncbi:MAG: hypothetical protein C0622_07650 [Desulfuromonas sp.]|nr:MAG: hypothetical protein C0622_07650 [Desulfuromonas sp.]